MIINLNSRFSCSTQSLKIFQMIFIESFEIDGENFEVYLVVTTRSNDRRLVEQNYG